MTIELPDHGPTEPAPEEPSTGTHPAASFDPVTVYEMLLATNRSINAVAEGLEKFAKDLHERGGPLGPRLAHVLKGMYMEAVAPAAIEVSKRISDGTLVGGREVMYQAIKDLGL